MDQTGISRRGALTGASLGVTLPVLVACGGEDGPERAGQPSADTSPSAEPSPSDPPTTPPDTGRPPGIAAVADVPVGGGLVLAKHQVVITQPIEGDFRGFTAVCTHAGCTVAQVTDTIDCPCHGSMFSIEDGSVVGGPAPSPLAGMPLKVVGDRIDLA